LMVCISAVPSKQLPRQTVKQAMGRSFTIMERFERPVYSCQKLTE
jgi:hypothetical protein